MKKKAVYFYLALCLLLCILPVAGMAVYQTDETTENRKLAAVPLVMKEGHLNTDYFEECGAWFEDHFSFRKELVTVDALIQSRLFSVSNVDTVMTGTDGWLYYTDTLDDYLRTNTMNPRQVFNVANNVSLLQRYVTEQGAVFAFTVAPNKNSLYGEHMPWYAGRAGESAKNIDLIEPELARAGISYVDLFSAFERTDETLYLKRDSHWNEKGAVLAYNTIFDDLLMEHKTYETVDVLREKREIGDLNRMLYPLAAEPEWNFYYQGERHWDYTTEPKDVEAAWIQTACKTGTGSLLMFRDSFGNTLLPLMAEHFAEASFSKGVPYLMESYMEQYRPEVVIVEKVERNLDEYLSAPAVIEGLKIEPDQSVERMSAESKDGSESAVMPVADGAGDGTKEQSAVVITEGQPKNTQMKLEESQEDMNYFLLSGDLGDSGLADDTQIFVRLRGQSRDEDETYEAFTVSTEQSDYGFALYLKKDTLAAFDSENAGTITADVLIMKDGAFQIVDTGELDAQVQP